MSKISSVGTRAPSIWPNLWPAWAALAAAQHLFATEMQVTIHWGRTTPHWSHIFAQPYRFAQVCPSKHSFGSAQIYLHIWVYVMKPWSPTALPYKPPRYRWLPSDCIVRKGSAHGAFVHCDDGRPQRPPCWSREKFWQQEFWGIPSFWNGIIYDSEWDQWPGHKPWGIHDNNIIDGKDSCTSTSMPSGTNNVEAVFEFRGFNDLLLRDLASHSFCWRWMQLWSRLDLDFIRGNVSHIRKDWLVLFKRKPVNSRSETMTCPRNLKSWRQCSDWWAHDSPW